MIDNFNQFSNNTDLLQVMKAFQFETFAKLNVMRIGIIEEILTDNEVRCSITNKKLIKTNPDGSPVWADYPPIYAKVWYMGSELSGIDFTPAIGSPCLLLFNDREFNSYFSTGVVSPLSNALMHDLSYAVCVPLYQPTIDGNFNIKTDGILNINATTINLTATTVNINGVLNINGSPYLAHTHITGAIGSPTGGVNP